MFYFKVFVLMQFDPGLEYKPNRGEPVGGTTSAIANTTPLTSTANPKLEDPS